MKQTLTVTGMSCSHCASRIEEALLGLDGVKKASVKLKKEEVKVNFDESLQTIEKISQTIDELGYQVQG
ncbi:copper ion binding protein [Vagococcus sp.]|uniref:copper ion binding protein n=1 Tax=Vagococcus sp. TaxID=1933889 RepID=UPI003F9D7E4D